MPLPSNGLFLGAGSNRDPPRAPVIAHMVPSVIDDHRLVVHVPDIRNVVHGAVVEKGSAAPISAFIAETCVAEAVVNTAVKSDARTPVALMKKVDAIAPSPVTRCPEE